MGYYIKDTETQTKEQFLSVHGTPIDPAVALMTFDEAKFAGKFFPVCLVDNGPFTAAGIAYSQAECKAFLRPDSRPRKWFIVPIEDLKPWYNPEAS